MHDAGSPARHMANVGIEMKLFSEQGHDLRHFHDRRRRDLGTYADDPTVTHALTRLYDKVVMTDQVIWCSFDQLPFVPLEMPRFLHTIEADRRDVLAVLDGFIWESGILRRRIVPADVREKIKAACSTMVGASRLRAIDQKIDDYLGRELPTLPWSHLIRPDTTCRMPQVLLKWPIRFSRVGQPEVIQL